MYFSNIRRPVFIIHLLLSNLCTCPVQKGRILASDMGRTLQLLPCQRLSSKFWQYESFSFLRCAYGHFCLHALVEAEPSAASVLPFSLVGDPTLPVPTRLSAVFSGRFLGLCCGSKPFRSLRVRLWCHLHCPCLIFLSRL